MLNQILLWVVQWSHDRNIIFGSTPRKQAEKAQEELNELFEAIDRDCLDLVKDGIGDTIVCLTNIAEQYGLTIEECVFSAYNEIKHRKGKMIDGKFVKEADLEVSRH